MLPNCAATLLRGEYCLSLSQVRFHGRRHFDAHERTALRSKQKLRIDEGSKEGFEVCARVRGYTRMDFIVA